MAAEATRCQRPRHRRGTSLPITRCSLSPASNSRPIVCAASRRSIAGAPSGSVVIACSGLPNPRSSSASGGHRTARPGRTTRRGGPANGVRAGLTELPTPRRYAGLHRVDAGCTGCDHWSRTRPGRPDPTRPGRRGVDPPAVALRDVRQHRAQDRRSAGELTRPIGGPERGPAPRRRAPIRGGTATGASVVPWPIAPVKRSVSRATAALIRATRPAARRASASAPRPRRTEGWRAAGRHGEGGR